MKQHCPHRRDFLARSVALVAASALLPTCTREQPLTLGVHPWIGYETFRLARDFGWLPASVRLHEGRRAGDSLRAIRAGEVDAAALTLDEVLLARAAGVPLLIVAVLDISAGADVLLVRPGIKSLAGLAGRRIGLEKSALGETMLLHILEAARLAPDSVVVLDRPPERQLAAWRGREVDAVVSYEPMASRLEQEGALRLFDTRQMPETIFDVLAVRRDRLDGRGRALRETLHAHFQTLDYLRLNRIDAVARIAALQDVDLAAAYRALGGVSLPDPGGNRLYLAADSRLLQAAELLNDLMAARGLLPRLDALDDLIDLAYLPEGT